MQDDFKSFSGFITAYDLEQAQEEYIKKNLGVVDE